MRYNSDSEQCDHCSNHYFEGKAMYIDCEGKYCEEAEMDLKGFSCPANENFKDLTPEEEAEAQKLEDPEMPPAFKKLMEENIYQHKCCECGDLFDRKGKIAVTCDKCLEKYKGVTFLIPSSEDIKYLIDEGLLPRIKDHAPAAEIHENEIMCPNCHGIGELLVEYDLVGICQACNGSGWVNIKSTDDTPPGASPKSGTVHKRPSATSGGGHVIRPGVSGQPSTGPKHFTGPAGVSGAGMSMEVMKGIHIPVTIVSAGKDPEDDDLLAKITYELNRTAYTRK